MSATNNSFTPTSQFVVICKNMDFEWLYIRIHTKEKPFSISSIILAILPKYQKKYCN